MNLLGSKITSKEPHIIYAHPFDFLSISEVLKLYDKDKIPLFVLAFYMARFGSLYKTLKKATKGSKTIKSIINDMTQKS
jgi:hypothetical protein